MENILQDRAGIPFLNQWPENLAPAEERQWKSLAGWGWRRRSFWRWR